MLTCDDVPRARDSADRVQIMVRSLLEGGRVGQGAGCETCPRHSPVKVATGLNLSEDLLVEKFCDPRGGASACAPASTCVRLFSLAGARSARLLRSAFRSEIELLRRRVHGFISLLRQWKGSPI